MDLCFILTNITGLLFEVTKDAFVTNNWHDEWFSYVGPPR